jgi:cell division septum initiation protein DivIVA
VAKDHESLPSIPVGFRGYDRTATDAVLAALEKHSSELARERDELTAKVDELLRELEQRRSLEQAVADALVSAQMAAGDIRLAAEREVSERRREVEEEREKLVEEGTAIRATARREATEIVREARLRAERMIEEVLAALEELQHETDVFVGGTRERLSTLVGDLLQRLPGSAPEQPAAPAPSEADGDAPSTGIVAA